MIKATFLEESLLIIVKNRNGPIERKEKKTVSHNIDVNIHTFSIINLFSTVREMVLNKTTKSVMLKIHEEFQCELCRLHE